MEFENEPTDDQLDQLLRDVVIPSDLTSRLKQIPGRQAQDLSPATPATTIAQIQEKSKNSWLTFVLAASLIGIGLFVASQFWPTTDVPFKVIAGKDDPKVKIGVKSPQSTEIENELAKFRDQQESLEAAIHEIEVAQMEAQLAELEQTAVIQLEQREVESMIAAMSEEYAIPLGMPKEQVRSAMSRVIEQYPGTRGAEISFQFLEQSAN